MFADGSAFAGGISLPPFARVQYSEQYTKITPIGRAWKPVGVGGSSSTQFGTPTPVNSFLHHPSGLQGPVTALLNIYSESGVENQNLVEPIRCASGNGYYCHIGYRSLTAGAPDIQFHIGAAYTDSHCFYSPPLGFAGLVALVFDGAWTVYANGDVVTPRETTTAQPGVSLSSESTLTFQPSYYAQYQWRGLLPVNFAAICKGAFSADKVRAISRNPWQVFA
jgi:hypothetical protein